jgi:hypothetical protein
MLRLGKQLERWASASTTSWRKKLLNAMESEDDAKLSTEEAMTLLDFCEDIPQAGPDPPFGAIGGPLEETSHLVPDGKKVVKKR